MKPSAFNLSVCLFIFSSIFLPGPGASEELVIVGTGAGIPVLTAVAKAFTEQNPGIIITIPKSIGSGGGIKEVGIDAYRLGRVARDIADKEKKYGLTQQPLAKLPIVFYVNKSVSMENITPEQACSIYSGAVRKWEDLHGGKGAIRVIQRETGDSSLMVLFKTLPGFAAISQTRISKITYTDQETLDACIHQENSIAYGTLADVKDTAEIRVLKLGGLAPSDPDYPHFGPLDLVYKEKNNNGALKKFIDFIPSDAAKNAIITAGGLPVE